jgi:hypothetical protein
MSIRVAEDGAIRLEGECSIDDVEPLLRTLLERPLAELDWRSCRSAHTAVVQLMLASGRAVAGPPDDVFLRRHVAPLFRGSTG